MSNANAEEASDVVCGWCGIAEVDNIKLEDCDGCDLVKYCGDKCRGEHRHWHAGDCKRRAKELHDDGLFEQPDGSHFGECPLCFLPMPVDPKKSTCYSCCSKIICDGCLYVHHIQNKSNNCPFCREPLPDDKELDKRHMERVKANDPAALSEMGTRRYHEGDYDIAFEYWTKAAELGDVGAHYQLADSYHEGDVVERDMEKKVYHYEMAAIGGHPTARHILAADEHENGNIERSLKHLLIAANLGHEDSMKYLWKHYSAGNITKEELETTLRTHQAAIDATKSPQREAAEVWRERQRGARRRN
jgi:hypothetical protein